MKRATLGIVLNDKNEVLLGEKKKGEIGIGRLSGPGGKMDPYETISECLIRETLEELELELDPKSLNQVAHIDFRRGRTRFVLLNKWLCAISPYLGTREDFSVYVLLAKILRGEVHETTDMIPGWYPLEKLPFDRMYAGDHRWFLAAARGDRFDATVFYVDRARTFHSIKFFSFGSERV